MLVPSAASAQRGTLDRYRASETPEDDFHLSRPGDLGHLRFGAQLQLDYGYNLLVFEPADGDRFPVVEHQLNATAGLSLGLVDRVVVYAGLPVTLALTGASADEMAGVPVAVASGAGLGDVYLGARVRIFGEDDDIFTLGGQATLTLPTSIGTYRGDATVTGHPEVLAELRPFGGLRIVGNLGALIREETTVADSNFRFGHELTYALGVAMPVWTEGRNHLDVHTQLYGASAFAQFGEREGTALELTGGLKFFHETGLVVGAAGGGGITRGFGTPDARIVASVGWTMPEDGVAPAVDIDADGDGVTGTDACPTEAEDLDGFADEDGCPDPDNDADGVPDSMDGCPNAAETANGHQDEDGCPDEIGDRDGDGTLDPSDACPDEPEDIDGFADADGCPELDNDEDGVLDAEDACLSEPGPAGNRGCPEADRDGDGLVDRLDNCPDEAGSAEHHGCVDAQTVVVTESGIELNDRVFFRANRSALRPRSSPLLRSVARVLLAHPEITSIHVEGHTDVRGRRARNVAVSQARAEAVVDFLVDQGVARERLVAEGFGPDRPLIEDAATDEQHGQNRRVEFRIR
ncbi:MAG: OmpA family protein [Sandaracinaceae bacterium]